MKVIIIGATIAGTTAVSQLIQSSNDHVDVTVYERSTKVAFVDAGVPLFLSKKIKHLDSLALSSASDFTKLGVNMQLKHDVLKIDVQNHEVLVQDLDSNRQFMDTYDKLILATGSVVTVPPIIGVTSNKVKLVKNYDTTQELVKTLVGMRSIAIAGGGYLGVELAEALCSEHDVTLYQSRKYLLNHYYDEPMAETVRQLLTDHGVQVYLNDSVSSFVDHGDHLEIVSDNRKTSYDLAIVCTGFMPLSSLVRGQVKLDRRGAVITNDFEQTSNHDVYAIGDVRTTRQNATNQQQYLPQLTNAIRQAKIAALHINGYQLKDRGAQGTTALSIFDTTYSSAGITQRIANKLNIPTKSVTYDGPYRATFMKDNANILVTLVYHADNHRVLGIQIRCPHDVTQAANTVSLAIQNHNTIEDLALTDMFFHPRYNRPVNFLNEVAMMAIEQDGKIIE